MLKYTIAFIKRNDEILLLNRESSTWMGSWNGVGGKIEPGETPKQGIIREIKEETGIHLNDIEFKGTVTWNVNSMNSDDGMYAFVAEIPSNFNFVTPLKTREGILDWKKLNWILHPDNTGVANLSYFLNLLLNDSDIYNHHFVYRNNTVETFSSTILKERVGNH